MLLLSHEVVIAAELDSATAGILAGRTDAAIESLKGTLRHIRRHEDADGWRRTISDALNHPIRDLLHQDPLTERAFIKPRGYPGDAPTLDMVYRLASVTAATDVGRAVHRHVVNSRTSRAVRFRREYFARLIDMTARRMGRPIRVLSIAAGHLREADLSWALRTGGVAEYVAFDHDPANLEVVARDYGRFGVRVVQGSPARLGAPLTSLGSFDVVYSCGLFDYFDERLARRCARTMWTSVAEGGVFAIANYLPDIHDIGYLETFMDWRLVFRTEAELRALVACGPSARQRTFADPYRTIGFVEIERR